jgi:hypothetical protein
MLVLPATPPGDSIRSATPRLADPRLADRVYDHPSLHGVARNGRNGWIQKLPHAFQGISHWNGAGRAPWPAYHYRPHGSLKRLLPDPSRVSALKICERDLVVTLRLVTATLTLPQKTLFLR